MKKIIIFFKFFFNLLLKYFCYFCSICPQRDSNDWLDWLKGLKETHGSVEQSSLSLASDINNEGVYQVQLLQDQNGTVKARRIAAILHAVVNV